MIIAELLDFRLVSKLLHETVMQKLAELAFLDRLVLWSRMWQLNISYKNYAILGIGNNITNHAFRIATIPISNVQVVKDLGVVVDGHR